MYRKENRKDSFMLHAATTSSSTSSSTRVVFELLSSRFFFYLFSHFLIGIKRFLGRVFLKFRE